MSFMKISDFNIDQKIEGFYLIKEIEAKTTSNGSSYLDMSLSDNTGDINAKLWDCKEEDIAKYSKNDIVKIRGIVDEWQGKKQLRIMLIRLSTDEDRVNIEDYVQTAPYEPDFMYNQMLKYINKIENKDIEKIVLYIIEEYKDKLLYYPAAKQNHHAIRSGLLYHIMRMLMTAEKLTEVYTNLNSDLLFAGIILHDIAKIDEMDANNLGIVSEYTVEGQLLGHIIQGIKMVDSVAMKLGVDRETSILLQHMILSHHYEPEFGSPKRPMIPEAELLHYIDIIDARMYDMEKALSAVETNEFTDKIWILNNRKLFKSSLHNINIVSEEDLRDNMKKLYSIDKEEILDSSLLLEIEE